MLYSLVLLASITVSPDDDIAVPHCPPEVGQIFPDLMFPVLGEDRLGSLSEFRGTKVLLIQFASW